MNEQENKVAVAILKQLETATADQVVQFATAYQLLIEAVVFRLNAAKAE